MLCATPRVTSCLPQTAKKVGPTLAQHRDDSSDFGPKLDQPTLLFLGTLESENCRFTINQSHKFHYATLPRPQCSIQNKNFCSHWCIMGCETGKLWDLRD